MAAVPPEGCWGIDVRYVDGHQEQHWVRYGTEPDWPVAKYQTFTASCGERTLLRPSGQRPDWLPSPVSADWPPCSGCQTTEQRAEETHDV